MTSSRVSRRLAVSLLCAGALLVSGGVPIPKKRPLPGPKPGTELRAAHGLTGQSGWMLLDLDTGTVLDGHNADAGFVPASVAKLPTAAFALELLGADHRFETRILATGPVAGGVLEGDLVLAGGGDPELDTDALGVLADDLAARGLSRVSGRFLVDSTALAQLEAIDPGQNVAAAYNPAVSGLNLNFNRVHLKWDRRGKRREIALEAHAERLSPPVESVQVVVTPEARGPIFRYSREGEFEVWHVARRALRGKAARWLPVRDPTAYAGDVFRGLAGARELVLGPSSAGSAAADAELLAHHRSRPLSDILRGMLRHSTNLTAEVAGLAASRAAGAAAPDLAGSARVMNIWAAGAADFPQDDPGFQMANHSGLSTASRLSPRRMVELLAAIARRAPVPGRAHPRLPGPMAGLLADYNVAARRAELAYDRLDVVAKTGTLNYARGLAGYIATPGGRRLAFAVFSNDLARRGAGPQRVNRRWMNRARGFERALIRNWVRLADGVTER